MKKQIITLYLLCGCLAAKSQKPITTDVPCTDVMAQSIKGKWIQTNDYGSYNSKETSSRLNEIHDLVLKLYPEPTGVDAVWHRTAGVSYFGAKRKYYKTDDRLTGFQQLDMMQVDFKMKGIQQQHQQMVTRLTNFPNTLLNTDARQGSPNLVNVPIISRYNTELEGNYNLKSGSGFLKVIHAPQ